MAVRSNPEAISHLDSLKLIGLDFPPSSGIR